MRYSTLFTLQKMYRTTTLIASLAVMLLAFTTSTQAAVGTVLGGIGLDNSQTSAENPNPETSGQNFGQDFF
ncbi:hypothetical protein K492DRAFT_68046 [Lichtheimia hyalospora FSU 10163]|nr:hypothetical protein K492DRAFT_68046 [Lichtheimia hyalospora FSU 10163]